MLPANFKLTRRFDKSIVDDFDGSGDCKCESSLVLRSTEIFPVFSDLFFLVLWIDGFSRDQHTVLSFDLRKAIWPLSCYLTTINALVPILGICTANHCIPRKELFSQKSSFFLKKVPFFSKKCVFSHFSLHILVGRIHFLEEFPRFSFYTKENRSTTCRLCEKCPGFRTKKLYF